MKALHLLIVWLLNIVLTALAVTLMFSGIPSIIWLGALTFVFSGWVWVKLAQAFLKD